MNLTKINLIAFKTYCIVLFLFLMLGSEGMIEDHHIAKGITGAAAGIFIGYCISKKPNLKYWLSTIVILLVAMGIIGYLK